MLFSMNVQDLLDGLNVVTRALSARPSKQILEGVLLDAGEDSITLLCTDGSLSIETVLTAQIKEPGQVVLPGKLFTEIVRKLPGGEVTIKVNELERLGMVTKTRSETDRRVIQLDVSPQMTQSLRAYEGPFERAIRLVERSFTPEQIAVFCSILNTFTSEYIKDF